MDATSLLSYTVLSLDNYQDLIHEAGQPSMCTRHHLIQQFAKDITSSQDQTSTPDRAKTSMFSVWDFVGPRFWFPMAPFEQSMMELDYLAERMLAPEIPPFATTLGRGAVVAPSQPRAIANDFAGLPPQEDEFFRDLPMSMYPRSQDPSQQNTQIDAQADTRQPPEPSQVPERNGAEVSTTDTRGASSYSYSSTSMLDAQGRRVTSTRRRYEDSTGRLKVLHEREVGGKTLRKTWSRRHKHDKGVHECECSSGSAEEFEKLWAASPFLTAQSKALRQEDAGEQDKKLTDSATASGVEEEEMKEDAAPKAKL